MRKLHFAVAGVVVCFAAFALWRSDVVRLPGQRRVLTTSETNARSVANAQERTEGLGLKRAASIENRAQLAEALAPVLSSLISQFEDPSSEAMSPAQLRRVLDETVELLYQRWFQGSAEQYVESRRALGYQIADLETMKKHWAVDLAYESAVGEPLPAGITAEEAYRAVAGRPPRAGKNMFELGAIGADRDAIAVAFGRYCPGDLVRWPELSGSLGNEVWTGTKPVGFSLLSLPPGGNWDVKRAQGECFETATVGIIMEYDSGIRIPVRLHYWFDTEASRWWLGQVTAGNMPEGFGGVIF